MISTPGTGCCASSFCSNASAGGHEEQPSEVKSSTTTGLRPASTAEFCAFASAMKTEHTIKRARYSLNTAGKFLIVSSPQFAIGCRIEAESYDWRLLDKQM